MGGITHYQPLNGTALPVTSRLAGRLLQQAQGQAHASGEVAATTAAATVAATAATTAATTPSSVFAAAQHYITSSYASASFMSQIVVLVVIGLSGLMVFVLGLMWTAEIMGARRNRRRASAAAKAAAKERGFSTPTATPLSSPDLESPTKQLDDALLEEVSAFNKGVQLVINESTGGYWTRLTHADSLRHSLARSLALRGRQTTRIYPTLVILGAAGRGVSST